MLKKIGERNSFVLSLLLIGIVLVVVSACDDAPLLKVPLDPCQFQAASPVMVKDQEEGGDGGYRSPQRPWYAPILCDGDPSLPTVNEECTHFGGVCRNDPLIEGDENNPASGETPIRCLKRGYEYVFECPDDQACYIPAGDPSGLCGSDQSGMNCFCICDATCHDYEYWDGMGSGHDPDTHGYENEIEGDSGYSPGDCPQGNPVDPEYCPDPGCVEPTDGMTITEDTLLCAGDWYLPEGIDVEDWGDGITVECEPGTVLRGDGGNYGFNVGYSNYPKIKGCEIKDYYWGVFGGAGGAYGLVLEDNVIHDCGEALYAAIAASFTLINNEIYGCYNGVYLEGMDNLRLSGNYIHDNTNYGIMARYLAQYGYNHIVHFEGDNRIEENTNGLYLGYSFDAVASSGDGLCHNVEQDIVCNGGNEITGSGYSVDNAESPCSVSGSSAC